MANDDGTPTNDVLSHFGITASPRRLPGGQNTSWVADQVVLKPTRNESLEEWMYDIQRSLHDRRLGFRVAQPLAIDGHFIYKGWTAVKMLPGVEDNDLHARLHEIMDASRAMHAVLADAVTAPPGILFERKDRWACADRFAWDEKNHEMVINHGFYKAELEPYIVRLNALKQRLEDKRISCQLVHGDLSGNILFQPHESPAILDFDFYWRPVEYAEAIVLADGLTWQSFTIDEVKSIGWSAYRFQMLVRALIYRIVQYAIDFDEDFVQKNWRKIDAERAVRLLEENKL